MHGPEILARSLSAPNVTDRYGHQWQYHSQSDHHSKVGCWALLFDIIDNCPLLRVHVEQGKVGFGINHEMREFNSGRKKNLDLVLCTPRAAGPVALTKTGKVKKVKPPVTFVDLAEEYRVQLSKQEEAHLASMPQIHQVDVGSVHVALEAKACMTAHIRALPRLYDELNSSHLAIHGSSDNAIAVGYAVVNMSASFVSPKLNPGGVDSPALVVSQHRQPHDTIRTLDKVKEIPKRNHTGQVGFDALGIVVLKLNNDGKTPCTLVSEPPAPHPGDPLHYDQMIYRIAHLYATKFAHA